MIVVYESNGCPSCRKVKTWLENNGLLYKTVDISRRPLPTAELKYLFSLAEDLYDIVARNSFVISGFSGKYGYELEDLSFNQLIRFLQNNPSGIRRPLITDGKFLLSGFDDEEMTVFLPREKRSNC